MTIMQLREQIRANNREINKRIFQISEVEGDNVLSYSVFITKSIALIQQASGTRSGRRGNFVGIGDVTRMSREQLETLLSVQQDFLQSRYSQVEERKKIKAEQEKNFSEKWGMNEDEIRRWMDFLEANPRLYLELKELGLFSSEQLLEIIHETNLSGKELATAFELISASGVDLNEIRRGNWRLFIMDVAEANAKKLSERSEVLTDDEVYDIYKRYT